MARAIGGVLKWDLPKVSEALRIPQDDVRAYFTDGRRVSFILERRLVYEIVGGELASSEGKSYDLIDKAGQKWEVRSLTRQGMYFCPSYMVGSQRSFDEAGFLAKLEEITGYIISDVEAFPIIPFWYVTKEEVRNWYIAGALGAGTKISRARARKLIDV